MIGPTRTSFQDFQIVRIERSDSSPDGLIVTAQVRLNDCGMLPSRTDQQQLAEPE